MYSSAPDKPAKRSKPARQSKPATQRSKPSKNKLTKEAASDVFASAMGSFSIKIGDKTRTFKSEKALKDFMKNLLKGSVILSGRKSLQLKK